MGIAHSQTDLTNLLAIRVTSHDMAKTLLLGHNRSLPIDVSCEFLRQERFGVQIDVLIVPVYHTLEHILTAANKFFIHLSPGSKFVT